MKKIYFLLAAMHFCSFLFGQEVNFTYEPFNGSYVGSSACAADMTGDFLDDVVTVQSDGFTVYEQTDAGLVPTSYPLPNLMAYPGWSIAAGDFNADGINDMVFGDSHKLSFIKSDNGSFVEVPFDEYIFSQRTNFVDINNDGHLDAFACHDVDQSHAYRNDGNGNLILDISLFPTLDVGGNYASIWTDYNNDGHVDMYLSKCRGGAPEGDPQRINLLYKNNGDGTFTEAGAEANLNDGDQSWSTAFADFDNDGDMDAFISTVTGTNKFMRNNGDGTFTNITNGSGFDENNVGSWEVQSADFNNDGFVDILIQLNNQLFLNNGDMTFTGYNMPVSEGGIGDFNNDGFLDITTTDGVYYNTGNSNNWFKVTTEGVESNRNGIGAKVEIHCGGGTQYREIRSGEGFSHMNSLNTYFGLGTNTEIDQVVIKWPSGTIDIVENPTINQSLHVVEGSTVLAVEDPQFSNLKIYPNPTQDFLNLENGTSEFKSASIFDVTGKLIAFQQLQNKQVNVESLNSGTYILVLESKNGKYHKQKFMKR